VNAPLYYEDLSVGQTFATGTLVVEPDMITAFAADFDPQPFHLDQDAARASFFGELVASGWHTAALTMRLLVRGELQIVGGLIGLGAEELRWPRPVRPALEIAAGPRAGPSADHDAEPGRRTRDDHGRHHDRAPASLVMEA
jgi:acyl dehydratase